MSPVGGVLTPYTPSAGFFLSLHDRGVILSDPKLSDNSTAGEMIEDDGPGELEAVEIDLQGMPESVRDSFGGLSPAELNAIAWRPTAWSAGSHEKQIVLQVRGFFAADFRGVMGRGIHHVGDNPAYGNGTYAPVRNMPLGRIQISGDY